ncbi:MAG: preprotein translocase subunit TatC [Proteobacteria bacterium SG_bin4]|nr:MAG: preprotein translocase subunit TatC [Proteobacteria bacterium SG_bin4]
MQAIDKELDARGLLCPLPILRTKQSLATMSSGQLLRITATDKGSVIDFQVFAEQTGHKLVSLSQDADEFVFVLKKR